MLYIDLMNAVERPEIDNFTCLLFRLMLKADSENLRKLGCSFPVQEEMVRIYRFGCPYKDKKKSQVDWERIQRLAVEGA